MEHHVGIDVSLDLSSVCVLDAAGKVVREAKVASEPEALVAFLRGLELPVARVGLEAGPLSQWLYDGLREAGFETVLLETRHVKAALSAMAVKTDRRDARGIAQLLRMGWFRPVHRKSVPSQEVRALLGARKQLQIKVMDLEQTLRGLLRGFGLKVGDVAGASCRRACASWWRGTPCWSGSWNPCSPHARRCGASSRRYTGRSWPSSRPTKSAAG